MNKLISIDLDNTIIDYTNSFSALLKLILKDTISNKVLTKEIVKDLIIKKKGENIWTEAQSILYSDLLYLAKPFPDCKNVLVELKDKGYVLSIVSHKTQYPYLGQKVNLIEYAKMWIDANLKDSLNKPIISNENIFFEPSISQKIEKITKLNPVIHVDDLTHILDLLPSNVAPIWFSNFKKTHGKYISFSWREIGAQIHE